jgi:hypothetical protein
LPDYASATYGVKLSIEEASDFREKLIEGVYPELSEYLKDDAITSLATLSKVSPPMVRSWLSGSSTSKGIGASPSSTMK